MDRVDLKRQIALVTGAGQGLGRAYATALARAGAEVVACSRTADRVLGVADELRRAGFRAHGFPMDVREAEAVADTVARVRRDIAPIDLLINNAGIAGPVGPIADVDGDRWWQCVEVHVRGSFNCVHAVVPDMIRRRSGRIINVASGAGTVPIPYASAYVTAKTALIRFTEILAREVADAGVAVFAIEPGTVRTAMAEGVLTSEEGRRWMPWFQDIFDQGRDITAEYSAEMILELASGRADPLSGRLLSRSDDLDALLGEADAIRAQNRRILQISR